MAIPRVGDIGTELIVTIVDDLTGAPVDVSSATMLTIFLTPPGFNSTPLSFVAVFDTDGTNGAIKYVTQGVLADWSKSGQWLIQGFAAVGAGAWSGDPRPFEVGPSAKYPGK